MQNEGKFISYCNGVGKGCQRVGSSCWGKSIYFKGCLEIGELQLEKNRDMNGVETRFKTAGPVI